MIITPGVLAIIIASGYAFYLSQQNAPLGSKLLTPSAMETLWGCLIILFGILTGQELVIIWRQW